MKKDMRESVLGDIEHAMDDSIIGGARKKMGKPLACITVQISGPGKDDLEDEPADELGDRLSALPRKRDAMRGPPDDDEDELDKRFASLTRKRAK